MASELLTIAQYMKLNKLEKTEYINSQFNLKNNFLVGSVNKQHEGQNFFFAEQLINPYTGEKIIERLFSDVNVGYTAFCPGFNLAKNDIYENDRILFSFKPSIDTANLKKGSIVLIKAESIIKVEEPTIVLQQLNISDEDILTTEIDTNIGKIGYISNLYRNNLAAIFEKKTENLTNFENELQNKKEILDDEKNKLDTRKHEIETQQKALHEEFTSLAEQVNSLGFSLTTKLRDENEQAIEKSTEKEMPSEVNKDFIDSIHEQIKLRGLDYDNATIRQFYSALLANQFTILSGPSGTGKTSLISAFAEVTSSLAKVIPVQPSWTDKQDLLGYYNPLDKQYVPSQLLDALIEAKANQDKLYLICLDELNLAQIEYYFADILSLREQKNVPLELYSKYEYEQNMEEIKWFVQRALQEQTENFKTKTNLTETELDKLIEEKLNVKTIDQFRYVQRYNNLQRYKWAMHIPKNVRFIGTMNIDGTVRPLSPKVVDRSFIIPLERQKYDGEIAEDELIFDLSYEAFAQKPERNPDNELKANLQNTLSNDLQMLEANFNTRVDNHLDDYIAIAQQFAVGDQTIYDELILLKLLPRINKMIDNADSILVNFRQKIQTLTGENGKSLKAVEKMIDNAEQTKIFSYWS